MKVLDRFYSYDSLFQPVIEISYISHALIFNYLLRPNEHKKRVFV